MNTLLCLDLDKHLVAKYKRIHAKALKVCEEVGAVLNLATSDVCVYVFAPSQEAADKVAQTYGMRNAGPLNCTAEKWPWPGQSRGMDVWGLG